MALGHAVENAARADYDEAALIARVQSACRHEADVELPRGQASRVWPLLLSGALAAAALVAAVRIAVTWPASTDVVVTQPAPAAGDSHVDPLTPTDESAVAGSWHDPLDEEIAAAQSSLTRLGASPGGIDGTLSNMNQTLEAMSDELVGESCRKYCGQATQMRTL
jgi:hypothetical protein